MPHGSSEGPDDEVAPREGDLLDERGCTGASELCALLARAGQLQAMPKLEAEGGGGPPATHASPLGA